MLREMLQERIVRHEIQTRQVVAYVGSGPVCDEFGRPLDLQGMKLCVLGPYRFFSTATFEAIGNLRHYAGGHVDELRALSESYPDGCVMFIVRWNLGKHKYAQGCSLEHMCRMAGQAGIPDIPAGLVLMPGFEVCDA